MSKTFYTDYEKQFKAGQFTITRGDYLDLPVAMIPEEMSDEQMQKIVDEINGEMICRFSENELQLLEEYKKCDNNLSEEDSWKASNISEEEFAISERAAVKCGMRYWEDLDDDEYDEISYEILKFATHLMTTTKQNSKI